ncbi:hypothetical protein ACQKLN_12590, partial [Paenibacillus glucanolyticus]|uniref:hypothetical protein n=1 Tax=Paenibacillus glucanolyticus TaxID=59843 RepID=UPI00368D773B
ETWLHAFDLRILFEIEDQSHTLELMPICYPSKVVLLVSLDGLAFLNQHESDQAQKVGRRRRKLR